MRFFTRLLRTAKWRNAPASEMQKNVVAKSRSNSIGGRDSIQDLTQLTKGQAANIITRLKHGAKVDVHSLECNVLYLIINVIAGTV